LIKHLESLHRGLNSPFPAEGEPPVEREGKAIIHENGTFETYGEMNPNGDDIPDDGDDTTPDESVIELTEIAPEPENTEVPAGTVITTITNFDENLTYTLEGEDASIYEIDTTTGEIKVVETYTPDFETKDTYNFTIKAVDDNGNEITKDVTVPVEDVEPESEEDLTIVISEIVAEPENREVSAGTVIATITNFDENLTYTLEG